VKRLIKSGRIVQVKIVYEVAPGGEVEGEKKLPKKKNACMKKKVMRKRGRQNEKNSGKAPGVCKLLNSEEGEKQIVSKRGGINVDITRYQWKELGGEKGRKYWKWWGY